MAFIMTLEEAKKEAQKGIKVTHEYFANDEYMTIEGHEIVFEDGVRVLFTEWMEGKDYFNHGWYLFK